MMIGDGLNDVLSLKEAAVGVSINAKSELNLMASDVIVLNEDLWRIVFLFNLMDLANRIVYINLCWAFAYNIIVARKQSYHFYDNIYIYSYISWCILFIRCYNKPNNIISCHVYQLNRCCTYFKYHEIIQSRSI